MNFRIFESAVDGKHIEPAGRIACRCIFYQVHLGGANNAFLLATIDGILGASEFTATAITDFREDDSITILQNEIDLAEAAGEIPFQRLQAFTNEKPLGEILELRAYRRGPSVPRAGSILPRAVDSRTEIQSDRTRLGPSGVCPP